MDRKNEFEKLSTFDLAFNIATGKYSETDKFAALDVIKSRDARYVISAQGSVKKATKPPLKGSKAEKILNYLNDGKSPIEVGEILKKKHKITAYPAEIYRIRNKYISDETLS